MKLSNDPTLRVCALLLLCALSAVWTKLSPVAGFLVLLGWLSLPAVEETQKRVGLHVGLVLAAVFASAGFVRFVLDEAIPGVIAGGKAAATKQAIAFARSVVTAQDYVRQHPAVDPDHDGIGSALWLHALAGLSPTRGGPPLTSAPLALRSGELVGSESGQLVRHGAYFYKICLPTVGGGFSASPGAEVDEERAERQFLLFAWPQGYGPGSPSETVFVDQHERIRVLQSQTEDGTRFHGTSQTPSCDPRTASDWPAWKDKQPRSALPGDRS